MIISAAIVHDSIVFEKLIDAVEPIKRPRGRPRKDDKCGAEWRNERMLLCATMAVVVGCAAVSASAAAAVF